MTWAFDARTSRHHDTIGWEEMGVRLAVDYSTAIMKYRASLERKFSM